MKPKSSARKNNRGQGLVEYALISSLVGLALIAALMSFGSQIKTVISNLSNSASSGMSVQDGVLYIPNLSPTFVPTDTPALTDTAAPTDTPAPTNTPALPTPTPTELACTPGSASNIWRQSTCANLSSINHCQNYTYNSQYRTCSWH